MSFADDIKAFQAKALESANTSVCKAIETGFTSIVVLSPSPSNLGPYAKGLLANQYYTEIGGNYSSNLTMSTSDYGADSISRIKATIAAKPFLGKDNIVTMANNCDHAYNAEMLGWMPSANPRWKGAAPYKMVAKSVIALQGEYL
jgi:hypothetical protein